MLRTVWLFRNSRLTAEMEFLRTGISLWPTAHAGPECRQADNFGGLRFWADLGTTLGKPQTVDLADVGVLGHAETGSDFAC